VNNHPPELSPEARRIISDARGVDDPSEDDRTRVKTRWLASVAAVAGVSSLTEAARAAGGIGWGMKSVGAALALVAGAVGIYIALPGDEHTADARRSAETPGWAGTTHERFEKTAAPSKPDAREDAPVQARPRIIAQPIVVEPSVIDAPPVAVPVALPAPSAPAVAAEDEKVEARPEKPAARRVKAQRAAARSAPKAPPAEAPAAAVEPAPAPQAAEPSGQLGEELALLSQVRSAVQEGAPGRALELLSGYEARFGKPILEMEADALRVDALCRSGQRDAARASAEAFQNEWPNSPLGRRVAAACP
jgi:hypothetical protein